MRIFLIGMPGSGKSTIGRYLSESLNLPIYDLDKLIVVQAGKSIPEIFAKEGEPGFRQLEKEVLSQVIAEHPEGIISTGGGAPCFFDNLEKMQQAGKTVYIDVPLQTLIARTSKSSKRPLLYGDPAEKITRLFHEREEVYRKAEIVYPTQGRDSHDVAREIADIFV